MCVHQNGHIPKRNIQTFRRQQSEACGLGKGSGEKSMLVVAVCLWRFRHQDHNVGISQQPGMRGAVARNSNTLK